MYPKNKKYPANRKNRRLTRRRLLIIVLVLALTALGISEATNTTHLFHKQPAALTKESSSSPNNGGKSSSSSSTTPKSSSGGPASTTGQGISQTAATDTNGQCLTGTPSSKWAVSRSGLITLRSPIANSTFKSGATICGSAKVSKVWYRLSDSNAGVISYGTLNVIGGKFSGTLNFHPHSSGGQLDVFSFNGSGAEVNEVSVALRF